MTIKAIFLDRDSTLILPTKANKYISSMGDFFIPDSYVSSLRQAISNGYSLFVVSNQGGIAFGILTPNDAEKINSYITTFFQSHGVKILKISYCPHHPDGTIPPYNIECECRKPHNKMIMDIVKQYDVDTSKSWIIGDSDDDMEAGKRSGLTTILVLTGKDKESKFADYIAEDLSQAVQLIMEKTSDG